MHSILVGVWFCPWFSLIDVSGAWALSAEWALCLCSWSEISVRVWQSMESVSALLWDWTELDPSRSGQPQEGRETLRLPICPLTAVRRSLHPLLCSHTHWIAAYLSSSMESHTLPRRRPSRPHCLSWRLKKMQKGREGMRSKGHLKDEGELIAVSSMAARKCTPRARTWKHINAHTPVSSFCVGVYSPTCIFIYSCHNSVLSFGKQTSPIWIALKVASIIYLIKHIFFQKNHNSMLWMQFMLLQMKDTFFFVWKFSKQFHKNVWLYSFIYKYYSYVRLYRECMNW